MSWFTGYRRLNHRYERHPRNYLALLSLAATLCCYKNGFSASPHRARSQDQRRTFVAAYGDVTEVLFTEVSRITEPQ
jgi:hypothetical protein